MSAAERNEARKRRVTTLALVAAGLVAIAAVTVAIEARGLRDTSVSGPVVPGLSERLSRAKSIVVQTPDVTYRIQDSGRGWAMHDRGDYPVSRVRLNELTDGLSKLVYLRRMTSDPELHARLGVGDPGKGGQGVRVQILDADGAYLADLILGVEPQRLYVRKPDDNQVWAARGDLPALRQPSAWLDLRPISIDASKIQRVEIVPHEGRALVLAREASGFAIVAPARLAPISQAAVNTAGERVARVEASDVQAAQAIQGPTYASVHATTSENIRIDATLIDAEGRIWVKFAAAAVTPEATAAAEQLNHQISSWAFALSPREADALAPTLASLLPQPPAP